MAMGENFSNMMLGSIKKQSENTKRIRDMLASGPSLSDNLNAGKDVYREELGDLMSKKMDDSVAQAFGSAASVSSMYQYEPSSISARTSRKEPWDKDDLYVTVHKIMEMRAELEDLINGDNPLNEFLSRVTIREMIKELRTDIRIIKYENELTELDIIKHLEKEANGKEEEEQRWPWHGSGTEPVSGPKGSDGTEESSLATGSRVNRVGKSRVGLNISRGYLDELETKNRYKTNTYTEQTTEDSD